jgi:excisionase family DNA binding protein
MPIEFPAMQPRISLTGLTCLCEVQDTESGHCGFAGGHKTPGATAQVVEYSLSRLPLSEINPVLFKSKTKRMTKLLSNYEPLLTTAAVAKWLGISTRAVCLWAECKELPAIKIGRQWRFRQDELGKWLQSPGGEKVKLQSGAARSGAGI